MAFRPAALVSRAAPSAPCGFRGSGRTAGNPPLAGGSPLVHPLYQGAAGLSRHKETALTALTAPPPTLTADELAAMLRWHRRTVERKVAAGLIPGAMKLGRS